MTSLQQRKSILLAVNEAIAAGATSGGCAETIEISESTIRRWRHDLASQSAGDRRPGASRATPKNALTAAEQEQILAYCLDPEFASLPPSQIVPELLDRGIYIASESSFYRVLRKNQLNKRRGSARKPKESTPKPNYSASAPNQVWAWDVTWLPSKVSGRFFKLYIIIDLFSRKIVGWEVFSEENAQNAKTLLERTYLSENLASSTYPTVLHGDNGSPLKAATVLGLMEQLNMTPSHSRPRVSNDNAFAGSFFRTAKYHPSYPTEGFEKLQDAQPWALAFVTFYENSGSHTVLDLFSRICIIRLWIRK